MNVLMIHGDHRGVQGFARGDSAKAILMALATAATEDQAVAILARLGTVRPVG